ncbi:MAG TPA: PQQ-binding-like beta-propeller repeat protein [Vicinamibacterales bacterium]|nr:PQQ-binding-like beta-propeller repeat protein [Vicinamibacterales bacterium]
MARPVFALPAGVLRVCWALGILVSAASVVAAQSAEGSRVFQASCISCHTGAADSRAPSLDALRARTPQAIVDALMTGAMRPQGARLSGAERRAVAEFITGKSIEGDVSGASSGRCTSRAPLQDFAKTAQWTGWSPSTTNSRFQSTEQAGLTPADLPRLKLKWAFGFPDASVAWSHPTVAAGRVFVGSQNGTVYSLDAKTGCIQWTFSAKGGVRTALAVAPAGASRLVVYFGDTAANAYALDAETGKTLWVRRVDDHPSARITGSPTFFEGRLYVPVASYEEAQGADPQYPCCTFRGSISALDAESGAVEWKTYMIAEMAQRRGSSSTGTPLWGPAGAGIWSAPTVDVARRALYVATGNAYSAPSTATSDAVVALDLATGAIRWTRQVTANDVFVSNCRAGNPNCPDTLGPDHDFGSPPVLARAGGRDVIVIGQKSGMAFGMDPEKKGEILWQYRAGQGSTLGGIEWGAAVDGERAYFAVSDILTSQPGGLHAVNLATGTRAWFTSPPAPTCGSGPGCNGAQSAAVTAIAGAVFSGSNDGSLRAYSTTTGEVLWAFDSNRDYTTVNGVPGKGASMIGPGAVVAGGMVYVNSGYGGFGGRPGNVLLAFGPE